MSEDGNKPDFMSHEQALAFTELTLGFMQEHGLGLIKPDDSGDVHRAHLATFFRALADDIDPDGSVWAAELKKLQIKEGDVITVVIDHPTHAAVMQAAECIKGYANFHGIRCDVMFLTQGTSLDTVPEDVMKQMGWVRAEKAPTILTGRGS